MLRKLTFTAILSAIALIATGCMKLNIDLVVSSDDKVSGTMIVAYSNAARDFASSMGGQELSTDNLITTQPGMTVTPYEDDNYTGSKITLEPKTFSEFTTGSPDSLKFVRDGNLIKVTGSLDLAGGQASTIDSLQNNPLTSSLFSTSDISVSITMPGKVTSSTGKVEGNKVTFTGKIGQKIIIDAQADTSAPDVLPFVLGGAALLVVAGTVTVLLVRRRQKTAPAAVQETSSSDSDWN